MKNWEAYEEKIKELNYLFGISKDGEIASCNCLSCYNCIFLNKDGVCRKQMLEWLYEEYKKPKIKIPLATKVILENLDERWKWIAKDKDGDAWTYETEPLKHKESRKWVNGSSGYSVNCLRGIFKEETFDFLSWDDEEPTNIKELLENCEVIE